jgi:hypothetical protein
MDWGQIAVGAGALLVGLFGGRWTRQSAKESNAGQLYSGFTAAQGAELTRLSARVEAMEQDREEAKKVNREHMKWDRALVRKLRIALPDEDFDDPPPLDV